METDMPERTPIVRIVFGIMGFVGMGVCIVLIMMKEMHFGYIVPSEYNPILLIVAIVCFLLTLPFLWYFLMNGHGDS